MGHNHIGGYVPVENQGCRVGKQTICHGLNSVFESIILKFPGGGTEQCCFRNQQTVQGTGWSSLLVLWLLCFMSTDIVELKSIFFLHLIISEGFSNGSKWYDQMWGSLGARFAPWWKIGPIIYLYIYSYSHGSNFQMVPHNFKSVRIFEINFRKAALKSWIGGVSCFMLTSMNQLYSWPRTKLVWKEIYPLDQNMFKRKGILKNIDSRQLTL